MRKKISVSENRDENLNQNFILSKFKNTQKVSKPIRKQKINAQVCDKINDEKENKCKSYLFLLTKLISIYQFRGN